MRTIQKVAAIFAAINLFIGVTGFMAPLVRGNRDRVINTKPGKWLGIAAINWVHSLYHLVLGLVGLFRPVRLQYAREYVGAHALLLSSMAAMGWSRFGFKPGTYMLMGMAVDRQANVIHSLWSGLAAWFALNPRYQRMPDLELPAIQSLDEIGI